MSSYAEICVLTAALCADALAASFIYGADRVKIPPCSALIITSCSAWGFSSCLTAP